MWIHRYFPKSFNISMAPNDHCLFCVNMFASHTFYSSVGTASALSGLAGKNSSQWDVDWPVSAFLSTCLLRTPFIPQSALHLHCLDWLVKVLPNEMWTDPLALSSEQGIWYEHGDASHKYWAKVEKNCATVLLYAGQSYANHAMIMIYYACKGSKIWFNTYLYHIYIHSNVTCLKQIWYVGTSGPFKK